MVKNLQLFSRVIARNSRLDEIAGDLVVRAGVAPAAGVAYARPERGGLYVQVGAASRGSFKSTPNSYFDLASVSKPFLAVTVARLVRRGRLSFDTPLAALLPQARGTTTGEQSLERLLAHRAGLEGYRCLYAPLLAERPFARAAAVDEALNARLSDCLEPAGAEGYAPLYSDLGYALVGLALEHSEKLPLDALVAREVCAPLGLAIGSARMLAARDPDFSARVAPTESVPFRGGLVRAVVHDENAWALSGHGLSGHAGLFGTAESLARFGGALLDAASGRIEDWLSARCLARLIEARPNGTLRAGFDGKSASGSSAGSLLSASSFGHLGFTGTSLWCDPEADRTLVLLSNRVCPTRENALIRAARPAVHDALFSASQATNSGAF